MRRRAAVQAVIILVAAILTGRGSASAQGAPAAAEVGPGDEALGAVVVRPGLFTYRMTARRGAASMDIGTAILEIRRVVLNGDSAIVVVQTLKSAASTSVDSSIISARTLAPIRTIGRSADRVLSLEFSATRVIGESRDPEGSAHAIEQPLTRPVFHADAIDIIVSALPLRIGYAARLPVYAHDDGGVAWYELKVTGERVVEGVPAWDVIVTAPGGITRYEIGKTDRQNHGAEHTAPSGIVLTMTRTGG